MKISHKFSRSSKNKIKSILSWNTAVTVNFLKKSINADPFMKNKRQKYSARSSQPFFISSKTNLVIEISNLRTFFLTRIGM